MQHIGVDDSAVYLGAIGCPDGCITYPIFIFDKTPLLSGLPAGAVNSLVLNVPDLTAGMVPHADAHRRSNPAAPRARSTRQAHHLQQFVEADRLLSRFDSTRLYL